MTNAIQFSNGHGIPLKYANRHGLIAGATGTGKTVTLQTLCQEFAANGVPVFVADVKGDIAGLATGAQHVELWDMKGKHGLPFKVSLDMLGPDLIARMLELSDAQTGLIEAAFAQKPRMETLDDLMDAIGDVIAEGGATGTATVAAVSRAVMRFQRQGGGKLIGGPAYDIGPHLFDLETAIHILHAEELVRQPAAYGALMIWLLRELMERMPEAGDLDKPRLVLFIDEAHLLFADAPPHLVRSIEQTVRLIRSKGVGVYFVTQSPDDLPPGILGQLGNRIQHALRGATQRDLRAIKAAAETMPINPTLDMAAAIRDLRTGEALVSTLDEEGRPRMAQRARIQLPQCRLGAISNEERRETIDKTATGLRQREDVLLAAPQLPGLGMQDFAALVFMLALICLISMWGAELLMKAFT